MKAFCIQLIAMSCMMGFQNHIARRSVACKYHVASFGVKATIQTYAVNGL